MAAAANFYQIRKIYAIAQTLGMVNRNGSDMLHELVQSITGKGSVKDLTYSEARKVIGELEARQGTPPPRHGSKRRHKEKTGGASEGQQRKVWALMYQLEEASPGTAPVGDRLCGIIKKDLGMDAFPKDPFAWLDYKACVRLVEILKGYVHTARKKAGGCV